MRKFIAALALLSILGACAPQMGGDQAGLPVGTTCTIFLTKQVHDGSGQWTNSLDEGKKRLGVWGEQGLRVRGKIEAWTSHGVRLGYRLNGDAGTASVWVPHESIALVTTD